MQCESSDIFAWSQANVVFLPIHAYTKTKNINSDNLLFMVYIKCMTRSDLIFMCVCTYLKMCRFVGIKKSKISY